MRGRQPVPANQGILVETERSIATIRCNRPQVLNALNEEAWRLFDGTLDRLVADPAVRVVLMAGKGRAFCAGADLLETRARRGTPLREAEPCRASRVQAGPPEHHAEDGRRPAGLHRRRAWLRGGRRVGDLSGLRSDRGRLICQVRLPRGQRRPDDHQRRHLLLAEPGGPGPRQGAGPDR